MSSFIYLVRHALKERRIGDVDLTPAGVKQAQATAKYFYGKHIKRILHSPLQRARQTAAFIAKGKEMEMSEDIRLRERANWGDVPGQTFEEFVQLWDRCTKERDYLPPYGDSARKAGERLADCIRASTADSSGESIIMVTHGGLITDFLINEMEEKELQKLHPDFIEQQSHLIPECSITRLKYAKGDFKIVEFASIQHLQNLL